jgi:hypothetical protein
MEKILIFFLMNMMGKKNFEKIQIRDNTIWEWVNRIQFETIRMTTTTYEILTCST